MEVIENSKVEVRSAIDRPHLVLCKNKCIPEATNEQSVPTLDPIIISRNNYAPPRKKGTKALPQVLSLLLTRTRNGPLSSTYTSLNPSSHPSPFSSKPISTSLTIAQITHRNSSIAIGLPTQFSGPYENGTNASASAVPERAPPDDGSQRAGTNEDGWEK